MSIKEINGATVTAAPKAESISTARTVVRFRCWLAGLSISKNCGFVRFFEGIETLPFVCSNKFLAFGTLTSLIIYLLSLMKFVHVQSETKKGSFKIEI